MNVSVIGIDLGTTHSCVAVYEHGKCEVFENDHGARVTPSYVAFTDIEKFVGNEAKDHLAIDPFNTVFDSKRLLGRLFDDHNVQEDRKYWPFELFEQNGKPKIKVLYRNAEKIFFPEDISAMILAKMKEIAEEKLGQPVTGAVITVPAYFTDLQRQATKDAARIAGLNVLRLINEPTAAAIAFSLNKKDKLNVLVFDLGGGTFDVSVLTINNGSIDVKVVNGDTHLGGSDFDSRLVEHFLDEIKKDWDTDLRKPEYKKAVLKLRQACEIVKKSLSGRMQATLVVGSLFEGKDFKSNITRAKFEEICHDLFHKTLISVANALKDAELKNNDIDEIVLVGGSTRIPKVQSLLQEFFNGKQLNKSINPDEAVACGAAIQAVLLKGDKDELIENLSLNDVTPLSYGIASHGFLMSVVIPRNTTYPTTQSIMATTDEDFQNTMTIVVFQGERELVKDNHFLGQFHLKNLPSKYAGEVRVTVTINVDADGILDVSARELSTGANNSILIKNAKGSLSRNEVKRRIAEARRLKQDDLKAKEVVLSRNRLQSLANEIRRKVNEKALDSSFTSSMKTKILESIETILEWVKDFPDAEKITVDAKHRELLETKVSFNL